MAFTVYQRIGYIFGRTNPGLYGSSQKPKSLKMQLKEIGILYSIFINAWWKTLATLKTT